MGKRVSGRRTVLRSAAWSVPVVAFAAAAPAASASTPATLVTFNSVSAHYRLNSDGSYFVDAAASATLNSGGWPSGTLLQFIFDGAGYSTPFNIAGTTISASKSFLVGPSKPWSTCAAAVYANGTLLGQSGTISITG